MFPNLIEVDSTVQDFNDLQLNFKFHEEGKKRSTVNI